MIMSFLHEQMSLCENENLVHLKSAYKEKTIFSPDLKLDTFLLILEILKNLQSKRKFQKFFCGSVKKNLKKFKKVLKALLDGKKSIEKKKKKFVKSKKSFKKWIRLVVSQFCKHCLEVMDKDAV